MCKSYLQSIHARHSELFDVLLHVSGPSGVVRPLLAATNTGPGASSTIVAFKARPEVHSVDEETAVIDSVAELPGSGKPECAHRIVLGGSPRVARLRCASVVTGRRLTTKADVRMDIKGGAVRVCEVADPSIQAGEAFMEGDERSVVLANPACFPDDVVGLEVAKQRMAGESNDREVQ